MTRIIAPTRVAIVGGGVAGLYSALLLQRQGVDVRIFEAGNRIGGRIWTYRFTNDEDQFFEAGAMRIPRSPPHQIVLDLISDINSRLSKLDQHIETIPYILNSPGNRIFVNGRRAPNGNFFSLTDQQLTAERLGFEVPEPYRSKTAEELLGSIIQPFIDTLQSDFDKGFEEILKYDDFSFRFYLKHVAHWPTGVIDFVEVMCSQTNQYSLSFSELIMQNMDFSTKEWFTIKGGMDRLPRAMASLVGLENITFGARVSRISNLPNGQVAIFADSHRGPIGDTFDKVILAVPPAALKTIVDRPRWSYAKEMAIRAIHYEPLYKIGLRFKTRFWERVARPSFGGQSTTDLPSRWIVYPSNGIGSVGPGVLLLYSWMADAYTWLPLSQRERLDMALKDLSKLYGGEVDVYEEFMEGQDICWSEQWATGDAMFLPGQHVAHHQAASLPEGNIYFAGEHLSRHHTWIAGALDSAQTTTRTILRDLTPISIPQPKIKVVDIATTIVNLGVLHLE